MQQPIVGPGLCECGCGQATRISPRTCTGLGIVKGEPRRFVPGHRGDSGPVAFWAKVPSHLGADQCWEWQGRTSKKGYGRSGGGQAHRMVYEAVKGAIPAGLWVLHTCDNPPCCNPDHLWLGTNDDNQADMVSKGRAGHRFKVTQGEVDDMQRRYRAGISQDRLAQEFGLSQSTVSSILRGRPKR